MMESVDPGKLNKKIKILRQYCAGKDSDGFETEGAADIIWECSAQFSTPSGTESFRSGAEFSKTMQRFLIRTPPVTVTEGMFVRYKGRDYEITFANGYGDSGQYVELWTERNAHH